MKKKGFTLIELLAVIVILAILMVIAIPKILDVIENSRKSAAKSSAELYIDAIEKNNAIANVDSTADKIIDGQNIDTRLLNVKVKGTKPKYGTISIENGKVINANLCIDGYNVIFENRNAIVLDESCDMENIPEYALFDGNGVDNPAPIMKKEGENIGTLPILTRDGYIFLGWFTQKEGGEKITDQTIMPSGGATYYAHWKRNVPLCSRATTLHEETCTRTTDGCYLAGYTNDNKGTTIKFGNDPTTRVEKTLESGDAFDCDVDGSGEYENDERFYYVSDYYDTKTQTFDSTKATLIYYNNTKEGEPNNTVSIARGGDSTGPTSSMQYLPKEDLWNRIKINQTRTILTQIPNVAKSDFIYEGYSARLLTFQEIEAACGKQNLTNWPANELKNCEYLLENTNFVNSTYVSYGIETLIDSRRYIGFVVDGINIRLFYANNSNKVDSSSKPIGVRPVIDILKTDMVF